MRIIFAGTPSFAASHLEALIDSEHDVIAVITQPSPAISAEICVLQT